MTFWPNATPFSLKPLKHACTVNPEALPESTDLDYEFDYIDIGNVTLEQGISGRQRMIFANSPSRARKPLRGGDIIVSTVRTYLKAVAAVPEGAQDWVASTGFAVLRPNRDVDQRFLYRVVQSNPFVETVVAASTGVSYPAINPSTLGTISVPLPDRETQRAIADFLDRETARIDQLVEKKQRLVALLEEKLEDDILRAVTLGIDPDTELVPADELEWTSLRPRHWNVCRLKHSFRENTQYSNDGRETLLSLRKKEGLVPHNEVSEKEIPASDLINYKKVVPGQIVMNRMRAAIGLFGLVDSAGIVSPDYSTFDVHSNAHAAYFLRLFKTEPMMAAFRLLSKGLGTGHSGFMRLNADNFGRIRVAVPEYEEQRLISEYVEERIGQISHLQTKNDQSIDRLREYRAALITAAVTGQIDVSEHTRKGDTDRRLDAIEAEMRA
jgi:type I restriction enzyme S subunit